MIIYKWPWTRLLLKSQNLRESYSLSALKGEESRKFAVISKPKNVGLLAETTK